MFKSDMKNGNVTHWHLGSLASPGDREENASHHVLFTIRPPKSVCLELPSWKVYLP